MTDGASGTEQMRERIMEAGLEEFAAHGLAGARVDRIAATASVNKNSIYRYFASKEDILTAVLQRHMERVLIEVPFTPEDLPGFTAHLFDHALDQPRLMRLVTWAGLENASAKSEPVESMQAKLAAIRAGQAAGRITPDVAPGVIFTLITAIATAWTAVSPFWSLIDADAIADREAVRAAVVRVVTRAFTI